MMWMNSPFQVAERIPVVVPRSTQLRATTLVTWVLITSLAMLTGCTVGSVKQASVDLSMAGSKTAGTLAELYDGMAQDWLDVAELETFNQKINNRPAFDDAAGYEQRAMAMRRRAEMARHLADMYAALGGLAGDDAIKAAGTSAANLSKTVTGLPQVEPGFDPSNLASMITSDALAMKQASDLKTASAITGKVAEHVEALFQQENAAGAYTSVVTRRGAIAANVAKSLFAHGYIDPTATLKSMSDSSGLPWDGKVRDDDKFAKEAAGEVIAYEVNRSANARLGALQSIGQALQTLVKQHDQLANGTSLGLADIAATVARAQAYLDEADSVRKQMVASNQKKKEATAANGGG